jgi:hypothetical protein
LRLCLSRDGYLRQLIIGIRWRIVARLFKIGIAYQLRALGLRLFVKLNISHAVNSPTDAIDEMKWEHIEALKERSFVT